METLVDLTAAEALWTRVVPGGPLLDLSACEADLPPDDLTATTAHCQHGRIAFHFAGVCRCVEVGEGL